MRSAAVMLFMGLLTLNACQTDELADEATPAAEGPGVFEANFDSSPSFFTQLSGMVNGTGPHGAIQIWYSSNLKGVLPTSTLTAPQGTVAIKRSDIDFDGEVDRLDVMIKMDSDYDPINNNWYYEVRDPEGNLLLEPAAGKIESCISCHAAYRDADYLGGTNLTQ